MLVKEIQLPNVATLPNPWLTSIWRGPYTCFLFGLSPPHCRCLQQMHPAACHAMPSAAYNFTTWNMSTCIFSAQQIRGMQATNATQQGIETFRWNNWSGQWEAWISLSNNWRSVAHHLMPLNPQLFKNISHGWGVLSFSSLPLSLCRSPFRPIYINTFWNFKGPLGLETTETKWRETKAGLLQVAQGSSTVCAARPLPPEF